MRHALAATLSLVATAAITGLAGGGAAAAGPEADLRIDVSGPTEAVWPDVASLTLRYTMRVTNAGPGTSPGATVVLGIRGLPAGAKVLPRISFGALRCRGQNATVWLCKLRQRPAGSSATIYVAVIAPARDAGRVRLELKAHVADPRVVDPVKVSNTDVLETTIEPRNADLQVTAAPQNTIVRDLGHLLLLDDAGRADLKLRIYLFNKGPSRTQDILVFIRFDRPESVGTVVDGAGPWCGLELAQELVCSVGPLGPNEGYLFTLAMPIRGAGPVAVRVSATTDERLVRDPNPGNNTSRVEVMAR